MNPLLRFLAVHMLFVAAPAMAQTSDTHVQIEQSITQADYSRAMVLIDSYLGENPDDVGMRLRRAQVLRWQGDLDAALREYDALHERHPDDADYLFGRALILLQQERPQLALSDIRLASALAPDYEDVWQLYYRILSLQADGPGSTEMQQLRAHAATHFADAAWWIPPPVEEVLSWTLRAGGTVQHLTDSLAGWSSFFAAAEYTSAHDHRYVASVSRDQRFDNSDVQLALGADWQLPSSWIAGMAVARSNDAYFLPATEFRLHGGRPVGKGWVLDASFRRRNYENDRVDTFGGTVEYYFKQFRSAWFVGLSDLNGSTNSVSQTFSFNWYVRDSMSFGASLNFGEEAELIAPGQVLKTDVSGIAVTGRHRLNDRVSLDWWLGMQNQGDFYRRQYAGMAVSVGI